MSSDRPAVIYGLIDPRTSMVRYVGKSIRPEQRLANHMNDRSVTWRTNWLAELRHLGLRPELVTLQVLQPGEDWAAAERWWITEGRINGWPLVNATAGGDGVPEVTGPGKERMLQTWRGRKHSPESLVRIGNASRGRRHTSEHREMMRQIMTDREFLPRVAGQDQLQPQAGHRRAGR